MSALDLVLEMYKAFLLTEKLKIIIDVLFCFSLNKILILVTEFFFVNHRTV